MYTEVAFQAIYGLRAGNSANERVTPDAREARRKVLESKILISALLSLVALAIPVLLGRTVESLAAPALPIGLYRASVLDGLLVLDLALLWWTGLQALPTLLGAGVQPLIETLPIRESTLRDAALLTTARLFDLPALSVLIFTPLAVGYALGSPWAGLAILPGAFAAVLVAIGLALATGKFYVRHVQGSRGGFSRAALRWAYLVLWTLPAFALFGFVTFSPQFFLGLLSLYEHGPAWALTLLASAFPFPLAALPLYLPGQFAPEVSAAPVLASAAIYLVVLAPLALWMWGAPREFARTPAVDAEPAGSSRGFRISGRSVPVAILQKDLRIASRTPGFALLILLPLLNSAAIGLWSFFGAPRGVDVFSVGSAAVASSALLAAFFAPAFFAIEVYGYAFTRSLPISRDALLAGKVAMVAAIYLGSAGLVLGITALAVPTAFAINSFVFFVVAELAAIVAAALVEFGILYWRAERSGLPITGLYAGASWVLLVSIPGLFVAGAPLVIFEYLRTAGSTGTGLLIPMAATALAELALVAPIALRTLGRGSA